ncbi:MAG: recombinase family protein [Bacteroidales bacterium]|nr:recombinase family protein [Bacteroidales bacterium]
MEKLKNAVAYIRVSTKGQAGEENYGIDAQKQAIQNYAKENNYKIVQFFTDVVSGVEEHKPEWEKLILAEDIVNPPFEAVIIFKSDRVSRDIKQYFYELLRLERKGVNLISVNEEFSGELANVYRALILFCAEQERKNIALRTSHGRKIKASCGGYAGGKAPFGYYVKEGRLLVDEFERPVVEYIFKLDNTPNEKGYKTSYREITRLVNAKGYRQRNGKEWSVGTIAQVIKNRKTYQGYYHYGKDGKWVKGVHEKII